jgi:hypothetical protein
VDGRGHSASIAQGRCGYHIALAGAFRRRYTSNPTLEGKVELDPNNNASIPLQD